VATDIMQLQQSWMQTQSNDSEVCLIVKHKWPTLNNRMFHAARNWKQRRAE